MIKEYYQKKKIALKRDVYLKWEILDSEAFKKLSAKGIQVLLRFLQKRTWSEIRKGRRKTRIYNDSGLVFTYAEANALGISTSQFDVILKRLVEVGFIDIEHQGGGFGRDYSRYELSDRWRNYGTPDFKLVIKQRVIQQGLDVRSWKEKKLYKATGINRYQLRKSVAIEESSQFQGSEKL